MIVVEQRCCQCWCLNEREKLMFLFVGVRFGCLNDARKNKDPRKFGLALFTHVVRDPATVRNNTFTTVVCFPLVRSQFLGHASCHTHLGSYENKTCSSIDRVQLTTPSRNIHLRTIANADIYDTSTKNARAINGGTSLIFSQFPYTRR